MKRVKPSLALMVLCLALLIWPNRFGLGQGGAPNGEAATSSVSPLESSWARVMQALPREDQLRHAFQVAFKGNSLVEVDDRRFHYTPDEILWLGDVAVLISTASSEQSSHAETGRLGIHYLGSTASGFLLRGQWPDIVWGGEFGESPDWRIRFDLANAPVVEVIHSFTNMSFSGFHTNLVELQSDRPVVIAEIVTACIDSAEDDAAAMKSAREAIIPVVRDQIFAVKYVDGTVHEIRYEREGGVFRWVPDSPPELDCSH